MSDDAPWYANDDLVPLLQVVVLGLVVFVGAFAGGLSWQLVAVVALFLVAPHLPTVARGLVGDALPGDDGPDRVDQATREAEDAVDGLRDERYGDELRRREAELADRVLGEVGSDGVVALALLRHRLDEALRATAERYGGEVGGHGDPRGLAARLRTEGILDDRTASAVDATTLALDAGLRHHDALSEAQTTRLVNVGLRTVTRVRALRSGADGLRELAGAVEEEGE